MSRALTKQHLAKRRTIIATVLIVLAAILILYPVVSMIGGSFSSKQAYKTIPSSIVPLEGKDVQLKKQTIKVSGSDFTIAEGSYKVYWVEIDGEKHALADVGKDNATKQRIFVNPDNTSETYLAPAAMPDDRVVHMVFHFTNYPEALEKANFGRYILNTLFLVVVNTFGALLSSSLVAYGFSRFRFKGRNALFIVLLSTMMLPAQVSLIPSFIIYQKLGWYNTYLPLTVAAYFASSPWNVFLMRQFFMGLPMELDEAAKIDGCGPLKILWKVIVPQSTAVLLTITLSTAVFWWNDYYYSLIYLQDKDKYPVALGLQSFDALYFQSSHLKAAATVMMMIPPILMFFLFQKYFIQGTVISGVKG
ncbi:MAG: carbohydrate ABC transporter permease [Spirochaetales bacterium]|nr:carbohydrate ABC transporter permease [Spirochaetales bacterium]